MSEPLTQWALIYRPTRPEMLTSGPTELEQDVVGRHFAYLKQAFDQGQVTFVGRTMTTGQETFGLAVLTAPDQESARAFAAQDPVKVKNVMSIEVLPFRVVFP